MDCRAWRGPLVISIVDLLLCGSVVLAEPVDLSQVQRAADGFLRGRIVSARQAASESISVQGTAVVAVGVREVRNDAGTLLAYIVDLEPAGFVTVSADTDMAPVVAYSFRNPFPSGLDPRNPLYRMVREDMRLRRKVLAEHPERRDPEAARLWDAYSNGRIDTADEPFQQWPPEGTTTTGGWVETTWDQGAPYNQLCPLDTADGMRSVVGCVATAFAQVAHYHRACGARFDSHDAYTAFTGVRLDADSELYDFPSFDELNDYLRAVALKYSAGADLDDVDVAALSFACGVAVHMDYASDGSGASTYLARNALLKKFGFYSADLYGAVFGEGYTVLEENMINGLPALLSFSPPDGYGGHLVVCDGYNTRGEYHLNYGWGSDRPQDMTEAWYRVPTGLLYRDSVFGEGILNIQLVQPAIETDPLSLSFYGTPGQESEAKTLRIDNNIANVQIRSISCPDGFRIGRPGEGYGDRVESFRLVRPRQGASINVRFSPERAGGYYGTVAVHLDDGTVRYVVVKGWAFESGTSVAAGSVSGTWSREASPYLVTGDIHVPDNAELTIEPGVRVLFMGPYGLTVGGNARLVARGNEAQPVEFTAWNRQAGWAGLRFVDSGRDDLLSFCSISHARKGLGLIAEDSDGFSDADTCGGAVYCEDSDLTIENCRITNNMGDRGGAVYCTGGHPKIVSTIVANNASMGGDPRSGGVCCDDSGTADVANCTIVNNFPGGIFGASWDGISVTNCIVWGNGRYQIQTSECRPTVTFCDVQGGFKGQGNIDADPCFFDPAQGAGLEYDGAAANWALRAGSPCINAGTRMNDLPVLDVVGGPRVYNRLVDMGACENQSDLPLLTVTPATVDAGFVRVNDRATAVLLLSNTGALDLQIEQVNVSSARSVFSIQTRVEDVLLPPGGSIEVTVEFRPPREGKYVGTLTIQSTGSNAAFRQVGLRGMGISGTPVPPGAVSGTWLKASSPYTVTGDIYVPRGRALTIEPGVAVRFAGHFSLTVGYRGTLHAAGTRQDKIAFTAVDRNEGWYGIRFVNSGAEDVLKHCTIEYAKKSRADGGGLEGMFGGAILCAVSMTDGSGHPLPSSPTIDSCRIAHNEARTGGGIMCVDDSEALITNNMIVENSADWDGAGICIYSATCRIAHNVIVRNQSFAGGGIMVYRGTPSIANNTIVGNRPSAMHLESGSSLWTPETVSVVNNIIWNNEIYLPGMVLPEEYDIRFNDIQGGWEGEGNIDVDPLFADAANDDYHLKSQGGRWDPAAGNWVTDGVTSPCIDAGDPDSSVMDEPQPNGQRIDIGAYGGTEQASKSQPGPNGV